ncbi:MAG: ATP-binding cassette domain-containing protein [Archaeoglobaceae archaeon]
MDVIVDKLVKEFGNFRAVDEVSFEVEEGEIFGLLGPNGAGKTTVVMILATLLKPSSGKAFIAGHDVVKEASMVRNKIGVVFQETTLDLELTAKENLDFHARLYGLSKEERKRRIEEVLELVELTEKANIAVKKFSGGMKRRLEIARGLLHFPRVLFLDEPTLGLDAISRRKIWEYIVEAKKDTTIFLTTHYIEEAEKLCDRVAIMNHGKIVAIDKPERLMDSAGSVIVLEGEGLENLGKALGGYNFRIFGNTIRIYAKNGSKVLPEIISLANENGAKIDSAKVEKQSLEDVFIQLTRK